MFSNIEISVVELIQGKRKGFLASLAKFILYFCSLFFRFIVFCRNWIFDHGYFKQHKAAVPVISIGNIVAGGTGKTPTTLMIAQEFYHDFTIAILSRGYRSQVERHSSPTVLSQGDGPIQPAAVCGDEPYLLAKNLPKAHIIVGKNRCCSSDLAVQMGAQVILLDDGMQHRQLARDFEVVVINAQNPFGHGYHLPRGLLRENISALARADLIILNHVQDGKCFDLIKNQISKLTEAPLVSTNFKVVDVLNGQDQSLPQLQGKKVGIFCAIAHPEYFLQTVQGLGADIVNQKFLPDHSTFTNEMLKQFYDQCKKNHVEWILCTEKDFVKLDKSLLATLPIGWVKMRLAIVDGEHDWKNFIEKARQKLDKIDV